PSGAADRRTRRAAQSPDVRSGDRGRGPGAGGGRAGSGIHGEAARRATVVASPVVVPAPRTPALAPIALARGRRPAPPRAGSPTGVFGTRSGAPIRRTTGSVDSGGETRGRVATSVREGSAWPRTMNVRSRYATCSAVGEGRLTRHCPRWRSESAGSR